MTRAALWRKGQDYAVRAFLVGLCVFFGLANSKFFTGSNLSNVLEQASLIGIIAMGMTMLLVTGNFDLSIGGQVAVIGIVAVKVANEWATVPAIVVALVAGLVLGALNGLIVTRLRVNSLMATLGTGLIFSGIAFLWTSQQPVVLTSGGLPSIVGTSVLGVAVPVFVFAGVAVIASWLLHTTVGGREMYAVGANSEAARYAGVRVDRVRFVPFVLTGMMCGLAALILVGQLSTAVPDAASQWPLQVIAATVVGGVSIAGGRGTIYMAVLGVLLISVMSNGLNLLGLNSAYQSIFTGCVIVVAVAGDAVLRGRAAALARSAIALRESARSSAEIRDTGAAR
jgi:ribose/xylose/arabinose/galactoside ABC-type transport system permease subunit